ncbi:MAG: hypothetical protein U0836_17965 [Pirellulales bacterium]
MGQYHVLVNFDKREFVHPRHIGCGLKLCEQVGGGNSTSTALAMLVAACSGRFGSQPGAGGDFSIGKPVVGRWAGDRVAYVGDFGGEGDIASMPTLDCGEVYRACGEPGSGWSDISQIVRLAMEAEQEWRESRLLPCGPADGLAD